MIAATMTIFQYVIDPTKIEGILLICFAQLGRRMVDQEGDSFH